MPKTPPSIPLADSRSDREARQRQRRRVARVQLEVAKDILAMLERRDEPKKDG